MREILFRGKCFYNGKWVEGFIVASRENTYPNGFEMITVDGVNYDELDSYIPHFTSYAVDPSTIGQYTGLKDKNGKKIFEGDIVKGRVHFISGYRISSLQVVYDSDDTRFVLKDEHGDFKNIPEVCEVIGNIHDKKLEDFENGC